MERERGFTRPRAVAALSALALAGLVSARVPAGEKNDLIGSELAHWRSFIASAPGGDEIADDTKANAPATLDRVDDARTLGLERLALLRWAYAREPLSATEYLLGRSAEVRHANGAFEAEWKRLGEQLRGDLRTPPPDAMAGVAPALVRALGETALMQVRVYYDASLEYGRNTMPDAGLYYLGAAQAQRDLAALCRRMGAPSRLEAPAVRSLSPELDALERDLLAAYRPPASLDRHREFIQASATLKEAREQEAAGLRYGALLKYLQAVQRFAPLRPGASVPDAATLAAGVDAFAARLDPRVDHSLGLYFVEAARADLARATEKAPPAIAAAVVADVAPRYFAALGPAPAVPPRAAPRLTVTLVRWPYT
jgi:hypothetical protein